MRSSRRLSDVAEGIGRFLFRIRGVVSIPLFANFFIFGDPVPPLLFVLAVLMVMFGELMRFWAVSFHGPISRSKNIGASALITEGPYGMIRHPIYFGNFFVGLGFTMTMTSEVFHVLVYAVFFSIFYGLIIFAEERFLMSMFPAQWKEYRREVPLIFPRRLSGLRFGDVKVALISEKSTFLTIGFVLFLSSFKLFVMRELLGVM